MRKFFASAFGLTATLAIVAGLVFAWTGTASHRRARRRSSAVSMSRCTWTAIPPNVLLPNVWVKTAFGRITNNTGVPIALMSGNITGIDVPAQNSV